MDEPHNSITLIRSPWRKLLQETFMQVQQELFIISPYIKKEVISFCEEILTLKNNKTTPLQVKVITRAIPKEFMYNSSDISALQNLLSWPKNNVCSNIEIRAINNVHAKVWICDANIALIGSGNATPSGVNYNLEYGVAIYDVQVVSQVLSDWEKYWTQGTTVTIEQLYEIQQWINKVKDNSSIQQLEREIDEKYEEIIKQVGKAPHIGSAISFAENRNIDNSFPLDEKTEIMNRRIFGKLEASPESYYSTNALVEFGNINEMSEIFNPTQEMVISHQVETYLDIPNEPPWDIINDPSVSLIVSHWALKKQSSEIIFDEQGYFLGSGIYDMLKSREAVKNLTKIRELPSETVHTPLIDLWQALIWNFPILERIQKPKKRSERKHVYLRIETNVLFQGKKVLQCSWVDENRTSRAFATQSGRKKQPTWAIDLDGDNATKLLFGLNSAKVYHPYPLFMSDIELLLQKDTHQLILFFSIDELFTKRGNNFERLPEWSSIPIHYDLLGKTANTTNLTLPFYQISVKQQLLMKEFNSLIEICDAKEYPPSTVEIKIETLREEAKLTLTLGSSNNVHSVNVPIKVYTHLSSQYILNIDYEALFHIVFCSLYEFDSWLINIPDTSKAVYFTPSFNLKSDQILFYHELKNLVL